MRISDHAPRVAVYRSSFLANSETFIASHLTEMPRYETIPIANRTVAGGLTVRGKSPLIVKQRQHLGNIPGPVGQRLRERLEAQDLTKAIKRISPDLLHAHFGFDAARALRPTRRLRTPLIATFHGYDASTYPEYLQEIPDGNLMLRSWTDLMNSADAIVVVSKFLRDELLRRGASSERLHVISCGVHPPDIIHPLPDSHAVRALFVGRLVEKKGLADLLHAVAGINSTIAIDVVGDGNLRQALQDLALRLRVDATFHGMLSHADVLRMMQTTSLVVMPSKRSATGDTEGLPVTALEAASEARPVLAYAHSGLVEAVVDGSTGILIPEGDIGALREGLRRLGTDMSLRTRMGEAGRQHVIANFQQKDLLGRLADVYDSVLDRRRKLNQFSTR